MTNLTIAIEYYLSKRIEHFYQNIYGFFLEGQRWQHQQVFKGAQTAQKHLVELMENQIMICSEVQENKDGPEIWPS